MAPYSPRLPFPSEQVVKRNTEALEYPLLTEALRNAYGPSVMYRAILCWVLRQGQKPGVAFFAFTDMFGGKPKDADRTGPLVYLEDPDFEKWMFLRAERSRRQWRNEKARRRRKKNESAGKLGASD